jgi:hypothetical protein
VAEHALAWHELIVRWHYEIANGRRIGAGNVCRLRPPASDELANHENGTLDETDQTFREMAVAIGSNWPSCYRCRNCDSTTFRSG